MTLRFEACQQLEDGIKPISGEPISYKGAEVTFVRNSGTSLRKVIIQHSDGCLSEVAASDCEAIDPHNNDPIW